MVLAAEKVVVPPIGKNVDYLTVLIPQSYLVIPRRY
jgi:hypothetical protein